MSVVLNLPHLTQAQAPLTREVSVLNEHGERSIASIPAERALTVYVDKREIVTLMTLGAHPELLVLGYLRNQRLVGSAQEVASITVDWDAGEGGAGVAAVKTHTGIADIQARTAHRVVTTGCGQGSVFGDLMDEIDTLVLPEAQLSQARLYAILNAIRLQESTYKSAGSVHGSTARPCKCLWKTWAVTTPSTPLPVGCGCTAWCRGLRRAFTPRAA
jgi:FdhD protein